MTLEKRRKKYRTLLLSFIFHVQQTELSAFYISNKKSKLLADTGAGAVRVILFSFTFINFTLSSLGWGKLNFSVSLFIKWPHATIVVRTLLDIGSTMRFLSWNIKGLGSPVKRSHVFAHLKRINVDLIFLQKPCVIKIKLD